MSKWRKRERGDASLLRARVALFVDIVIKAHVSTGIDGYIYTDTRLIISIATRCTITRGCTGKKNILI